MRAPKRRHIPKNVCKFCGNEIAMSPSGFWLHEGDIPYEECKKMAEPKET